MVKFSPTLAVVNVLFSVFGMVFIPFSGSIFAMDEHIGPLAEKNPDSLNAPVVVMLHGALKSTYSMKRLENAFENEGYQVLNWDYDSRDNTVIQNAQQLDSVLISRKLKHRKIHFITHSMGGLIIRYYLSNYKIQHPGRLVMIAPPNQGSILATELQNFPPFRWLYKKTVDQVLLNDTALVHQLGIPPVEFGIIAGGTGGRYGFTWYLPGDDDSILSVEQTRLEGATDFLVLPYIHSTITIQDETISQCLYYIEHGRFIHEQLVNNKTMMP